MGGREEGREGGREGGVRRTHYVYCRRAGAEALLYYSLGWVVQLQLARVEC